MKLPHTASQPTMASSSNVGSIIGGAVGGFVFVAIGVFIITLIIIIIIYTLVIANIIYVKDIMHCCVMVIAFDSY